MATQLSLVRQLRLHWLFYIHYPGVPALLTTVACGVFIAMEPSLAYVKFNLALKIITTGILLAYIELFRSRSFYFFFNLGLSKPALYGGALVIDLSLWTCIAWIVFQIR